MKKQIIILAIFLGFGLTSYAQKAPKTFTVMFYNVENLFDTIDHPNFQDEEFTPSGSKKWDIEKYNKKLSDITRVILSLPNKETPAIIGFAEIENEKVLKDLAQTKGINKKDYKVLVIEGSDPRGIDCGLMYRPDLFKYIKHEMIPVKDLSGKGYKLRGILHVYGKGPDGNPLHIYVNHWKSRRGGVKETEYLRVYAGIALRKELDRLMSQESNPRAIIMGDFNDEPTNRSIHDILHAGNKRKNPWLNDSYNLMYDKHNIENDGSYNYKGDWQMFDQMIISYSLLNQYRGLTTTFDSGQVLRKEWMIFHNEKDNIDVPNRTYGGDNYYGGISDHFPIYVSFTW